MRKLLIIICLLSSTNLFAPQQIEAGTTNCNKEYLLDSIFPIDNIVSITVTNYSGKHTLTAKELTVLKEQLEAARFAGGLLIKPGHIILTIELYDNTVVRSGFVYASAGNIHFEGGVDKFNQYFSGTFSLPDKLNFDDYK